MGQGREVEARYGHPLLKKVELYNQLTNSWMKMKRLRYPRCNCNLVNVDEELYICGGTNRPHGDHVKTVVLDGIDIYNAQADRWENLADMKVARQNAGTCVIENKIVFVGGESTENVHLNSNEIIILHEENSLEMASWSCQDHLGGSHVFLYLATQNRAIGIFCRLLY